MLYLVDLIGPIGGPALRNVKKRKLFVAFVDFRKFFDTLNREALCYKLLESGITGKVYRLIKSAYQNCSLKIKLSGGITESFESTTGVKQGCSLSPNLSNLFQNNLHDIFQHDCEPVVLDGFSFNSMSWADDLILVSQTEQGLQKCIDSLEGYCSKWGLQVNASKTKCMVMSLGKVTTDNMSFSYGDVELDIVESYKYLGLLVTYNWNITKMIQDRIDKANRAIFMIRRAISSVHNVSIDLAMSMFDKRISPVLLFGCPIWGVPTHKFSIKLCIGGIPDKDVKIWLLEVLNSFSDGVLASDIKSYRVYRSKSEVFIDFNSIGIKSRIISGFSIKPTTCNLINLQQNNPEYEKVHSIVCKFALGISKYSSTTLAFGELGRFPIQFKVLNQAVRYWHRMEIGTDNFLLQRAYSECKALDFPWLKGIEYFFGNNGIGQIENQMKNLKECYVKSKIKQRLQDQYIQTHSDYIESNLHSGKSLVASKCYRTECYGKRKYLDLVKNPDVRTIFTRLRLYASKLADSKYRSYRFKNQADDNCSECHVTDDVLHRIFYCNKVGLRNVRSTFFRDISNCRDLQSSDDNDKLSFILNAASGVGDRDASKAISLVCAFVKRIYIPD